MALVNKAGQTAEQVARQDELSKQIADIREQLAQIKIQSDTLKSYVTQIGEQIDSNRDILQAHVSYEQKKVRTLVEVIQEYLGVGIILLLAAQVVFFWLLNDTARTTLQATYIIQDVLRGSAAFWYDAENQTLYTRDKENP